ncbi:MAG: hypothetical protein IKZ46_16195 [Victivallales bacterium]|nr:hypothetical protein [Victivallales bacterium]
MSFMNKSLLVTAFVCLAAGLFAQPFDGGRMIPPDSMRRDNQMKHRSRSYQQQQKHEEKTLDTRSPSNKLQLLRPGNHRLVQPEQPKEAEKNTELSDAAKPAATTKTGPLPKPVSGPGNPLAPPPKIQYPTMPDGKKVFECSHCHYIYYTTYMPDIVKCEKPGLYHEWHLIGVKGTIWFRCINCNTHVCCTKTPIRSQCDLESKHVWEVVGQLTPIQQKEELEKEQN